jgi:hypothetical protein
MAPDISLTIRRRMRTSGYASTGSTPRDHRSFRRQSGAGLSSDTQASATAKRGETNARCVIRSAGGPAGDMSYRRSKEAADVAMPADGFTPCREPVRAWIAAPPVRSTYPLKAAARVRTLLGIPPLTRPNMGLPGFWVLG